MEKHYNLKNILAVHNNDMEFVKTMAELFIQLLPPLSNDLKTATINKDFGKMHFNAHKLKASIDLFGVASLQQLILTIDECAKSKSYSKELLKDVEFVDKIINTCAKELKEDLQLEMA